jgi:ubiquinone/menaquinone biosynthesis C-methylase UbiE
MRTIFFGTGHCLKTIALSVGRTGKAYGIDISDGMLRITRSRLEKADLLDRLELSRADAYRILFMTELLMWFL